MTQLPSHLPHESTVSSEDRTTSPQNASTHSSTMASCVATNTSAPLASTTPAITDGATTVDTSSGATSLSPRKKSSRKTSNAVRDARKLVHFVPQDYAHGTVNNHRAPADRVTWVNSQQVVDAVKTHHQQQHLRNRKLIKEIANRQGDISESSALKALYEHALRRDTTSRDEYSTLRDRSNHNQANLKRDDPHLSRKAPLAGTNTYSSDANHNIGNTSAAGQAGLEGQAEATSGNATLGQLTPQQEQLSEQLANTQPSLLVPPLVNAEQHHEQSALQQSNSELNNRSHEQPNNIMKAQIRFLDEPSLPGFGIYQGDTNKILLDRHAVRLLRFDPSLAQQWLSFYQVRRLLGPEITHQLLEHLRQLKDSYADPNETCNKDSANAAIATATTASAATDTSRDASSATTPVKSSSMEPSLRQVFEQTFRTEYDNYHEVHTTYEQRAALKPDSLKISSYPALFQFTLQPYGHMWHGIYHEVLPHNRPIVRRNSSYEPYVHTKRIRHNQYGQVFYELNLTGLHHGIMLKVQTPLGPEEIWQRVELQERHDLIACHNWLLTLLTSRVYLKKIKNNDNLGSPSVASALAGSPKSPSAPSAPEASAAPAAPSDSAQTPINSSERETAKLTVPFMIKNLRLLANWFPVFTFTLNPHAGDNSCLSCNHTIQYPPYTYTRDNLEVLEVIEPELRLGFTLGLKHGAETLTSNRSFNAAAATVVNATSTNTTITTFDLDSQDDSDYQQQQHYFIPSNSDIDDLELTSSEDNYKGLSRCTFAIYLPYDKDHSEKIYLKLNAFFKDNGNINYISFTFTRIASKLFELMPHMVADSASLDWLLPTDECIFGRNYYTILGFKHNDPSIPFRHKLWLKTLIHPEDLATIHQDHKILQNAHSGNVIELLYRTKCRDGSYIWTKGVGTVVGRDRAGKGTRVLEVNIDINRVLEGYEQLQNKVFTDILTGLRNRTYLITHMEKFIRDCTGPLTIIFADITALKLYNDYLGHAVGDKLLCSAAILIKSAINRNNELIRISGDEIVCLLPNCSEQEAKLVGQQIIAARQQYNKNAPIRMPVFFSIGSKTVDFSAYTGRDLHGEEKEEALAMFYEAIQTADQIMQENKQLAKPQHYSLVQAYIEKSLNQSISLQDNRLF